MSNRKGGAVPHKNCSTLGLATDRPGSGLQGLLRWRRQLTVPFPWAHRHRCVRDAIGSEGLHYPVGGESAIAPASQPVVASEEKRPPPSGPGHTTKNRTSPAI